MSWLDGRDTCLRAFLYAWSLQTKVKRTPQDKDKYAFYLEETLKNVFKECRLDKWLGHRKSSTYRWSNSGSEDPKQNTLMKYPTKWIYDKILSRFNIDPYKGLNSDQYRAYFLHLYKNRDTVKAKELGKKVLFGFLVRFGFTPSLCENIVLKPQSYILLFKMFWFTYPLYLISKLVFVIAANNEIKNVAVSESTTNKISLIPTLFELDLEIPSRVFIAATYLEYFKPKTECFFIGASCTSALERTP